MVKTVKSFFWNMYGLVRVGPHEKRLQWSSATAGVAWKSSVPYAFPPPPSLASPAACVFAVELRKPPGAAQHQWVTAREKTVVQ